MKKSRPAGAIPPIAPAPRVPNRLVVKFKDRGEHRVAASAHRLLTAAPANAEEALRYASLIELAKQSEVKSVRGLFLDRSGLETEAAANRERAWTDNVRKKFPVRSKRAPEHARASPPEQLLLDRVQGGG